MTITFVLKTEDRAAVARAAFHAGFEPTLAALLKLPDEAQIDPRWSSALTQLRDFSLRPGKRVRPSLVLCGWNLAAGGEAPEGVTRFAAGLELLHTFMLVHDDVADRAAMRRGGPTLHRMVGDDQLAVVLGDHLYARALETMLGCGLPRAAEVTRYMLEICRHTAAGQFLDLQLSKAALSEVTLFQTLKVAHLKTARYGFVAPLVAGAMLGGGSAELIDTLDAVGRPLGLAFQLRDDLLGLFGVDAIAGKDGGGDFFEGKRTFPVIAAWTRADAEGRAELEALWADPRTADQLGQARALLERWGGRAATQRLLERQLRAAQRRLEKLPSGFGARAMLETLLGAMAQRAA